MADTVFHADVSRVEHVIFLRSGRAAAPREPAPSAGVVPVVFSVVILVLLALGGTLLYFVMRDSPQQ